MPDRIAARSKREIKTVIANLEYTLRILKDPASHEHWVDEAPSASPWKQCREAAEHLAKDAEIIETHSEYLGRESTRNGQG